jgi:predicted nucleic acid-binding protein
MSAVFLDTVGLIAVWDTADQWHQPAAAAYSALLAAKQPFVTTSMILLECGNAAARRPYRSHVNLLRQAMIAARGIVDPSDLELEQAWQNYDAQIGGAAGIVDQISFIIMRRLGLTQAFTNDRHFRAAGFQTLF